jgi:hypothetical protein
VTPPEVLQSAPEPSVLRGQAELAPTWAPPTPVPRLLEWSLVAPPRLHFQASVTPADQLQGRPSGPARRRRPSTDLPARLCPPLSGLLGAPRASLRAVVPIRCALRTCACEAPRHRIAPWP